MDVFCDNKHKKLQRAQLLDPLQRLNRVFMAYHTIGGEGGVVAALDHIYIYTYILYTYIFMLPPQRPAFCMIPPPKTLFRAVFVVDAKHPPHRPRFCMTPPASKILVQVLFLLLPILSVLVSVFIIRIVISIIIVIRKTITITAVVPATISTSITILIAK